MTGAAWLPSARAVRCSVKSSNERNPFQMLYFSSETARVNWEEGGDDVKSAWPLTPWATHMLQWKVIKGCQIARWSQSHQNFSQFGLRAATRPHEAGIASNRESAMSR